MYGGRRQQLWWSRRQNFIDAFRPRCPVCIHSLILSNTAHSTQRRNGRYTSLTLRRGLIAHDVFDLEIMGMTDGDNGGGERPPALGIRYRDHSKSRAPAG